MTTTSASRSRFNGEILHALKETRIVIEQWRRHDNTVRLHIALGWKPPAPETIAPIDQSPVFGVG